MDSPPSNFGALSLLERMNVDVIVFVAKNAVKRKADDDGEPTAKDPFPPTLSPETRTTPVQWSTVRTTAPNTIDWANRFGGDTRIITK